MRVRPLDGCARLLLMPVIHLGFREADGGAVLSMLEVVQ